MAVKLSGSVSRKVPIPGLDFSSQSFGASLEIEINSADAGEVQSQLTQLYDSLSRGIDAQIAAVGQQPEHAPHPPVVNGASARTLAAPVQAPPPVQQPRNGYVVRNRVAAATGNGNGSTNGNGRRVTCTEAQAKCIYAICKAQGLDMISVLADYNVADARDLHVRDASRLIDSLKSQNGNGTAAH